jgi:membrane protein implicated in regulation of membrane protease activity
MSAWIIWLIAAAVLLVFEMVTLTFYVLWLTIGAAAAAVIALIAPEGIVLQVAVGCLVALGLTFFTKPLARRFRASKGFKDEGTELVGKQGIVLEPIHQGQYGIVKVGGDTWSATSDHALGKDEPVRVIKRGSTIIEVERWEEVI